LIKVYEDILLFKTFPGTPATIEFSGTDLVTIQPAAITLPCPMFTPSKTVTPEPSQQLSPITTPFLETP